MGLFSLEHGKASYGADFVCYGLLVAALAVAVLADLPAALALRALGWAAAGVALWSLAEYLLHRWVLHGLQPFKRWHALHHDRPRALIATPTALTVALFFAFVFLPAWWLGPPWRGCALTLGVLAGYLGYTVTHHAVHHWHGASPWLRQHKRWHALHHRAGSEACYGVTSAFWDRVFASTRPNAAALTVARAPILRPADEK
jgi:cyclopropane-fatty-acyl-phospholipid synthase